MQKAVVLYGMLVTIKLGKIPTWEKHVIYKESQCFEWANIYLLLLKDSYQKIEVLCEQDIGKIYWHYSHRKK